ncbi:hypothetical protein ES703_33230 [subsurface metagenome]
MSKSEELVKDKEGRFICPNCGMPMENISLTFYEITRWKWNDKTKRYERIPTDGETSYKCDHCGAEIDWDIGKELKD